MNTTLLTAVILTATGLLIRYHISRRRFNRRGIGGLQEFPTYGRFIITMAVEKIIYFFATLCLLAGLFTLTVTVFKHFKF